MENIPQWVRVACDRWGRQKRRIWSGGDWFRDHKGEKRHHVDGYASSFLGRLLEEREAAGEGGVYTQHWPEVLWGDGLEVQRAIVGMPVQCYDTLHLRYVWDPEFGLTAAAKAEILGITTRGYWTALERAEFWIWARLEPQPERLSPSGADPHSATHEKTRLHTLQLPRLERTRPIHSPNMPELSLQALQRPTLTLPRRR